MTMRTSSKMCRVGVLAALAFASAAGWAQEPTPAATFDPLVRPAPVTSRGASAFLLSATLAGKRLVAVGERGIILTSDDNGVQWSQSSNPVSVLMTSVKFATPLKGWAVGHSGVVLHTDDAGKTWVRQLDGKKAAQIVLDAATKRAAEAKPDDVAAKRAVADAERLVADGADKPFFDIYAESENVALIVGAYGLIFRTEDGGKSWHSWQDHLSNTKGAHLYSIQSAGDTIYIAGEQGVLYSSQDKGQSFTELKSPYIGSFFGFVALSDKKIVAYGLRGNCFWSDDAGKTWQPSSTGTQASLTGGIVDADGSIVLVSLGGNVLRSQDEGHTFSPVPVASPYPYSSLVRASDGNRILVGVRGVSRLSAVARQRL